jgi:hypothetical protein
MFAYSKCIAVEKAVGGALGVQQPSYKGELSGCCHSCLCFGYHYFNPPNAEPVVCVTHHRVAEVLQTSRQNKRATLCNIRQLICVACLQSPHSCNAQRLAGIKHGLTSPTLVSSDCERSVWFLLMSLYEYSCTHDICGRSICPDHLRWYCPPRFTGPDVST